MQQIETITCISHKNIKTMHKYCNSLYNYTICIAFYCNATMHYELYSLLATCLTFLTCTDIELVSQNNCRCKLTAEREGGCKKNPDWGLGRISNSEIPYWQGLRLKSFLRTQSLWFSVLVSFVTLGSIHNGDGATS